ncbi:MAG TPA: class I SAM-dependent methyltransferase [Bryobacteraceae bacterium]|nr:class I SAM-dependent methyltransferase [Bryobacteraceae bacterium]
MSPASDTQISPWLADRHLAYHRRQFAEPYRSTIHLRHFVQRILGARVEKTCSALDAGCGAGANIFHLSRVLTQTRWTGVDIAGDLFSAHGALSAEHGGLRNPVDLIAGDFYHLPRLLPPGSFDLAFSIQTISWLDGYTGFLPQFLAMLKPGGVAFVTSLFTDFHVDARIQITEYEEDGLPRMPMFYNIYAWNRFRDYCLALGAEKVTAEDFEIDTELRPPASLHMGTFTERLDGGRLLQRSGPLLMPWKAIAIQMPGEL